MKEIIFDVKTQTETIIELPTEEIEKRESDALKAEQDLANQKTQKENAKAALLAKLGITEEEAKLLLS